MWPDVAIEEAREVWHHIVPRAHPLFHSKMETKLKREIPYMMLWQVFIHDSAVLESPLSRLLLLPKMIF